MRPTGQGNLAVALRRLFGRAAAAYSARVSSLSAPATTLPTCYAIRPDGQGDVTDTHIVWNTHARPANPSPLMVGRRLYLVRTPVSPTVWDARNRQTSLAATYRRAIIPPRPCYAAGNVYFQSEEGVGTVVPAGKQYRQLANVLNERTLASYAATDASLFIRTEKHLYRIQGR